MVRRGEGRAAGRLGPFSEVSTQGVSPARPCSAACGTASHRCCAAPPWGRSVVAVTRVWRPRAARRAQQWPGTQCERHRRAPVTVQAPRGVALPPLWAWQALATMCAPFLRPSAAVAAFLAPGSLAFEAVRLPVSSPPELESSLTRPGQRSSSSLSSSSSSSDEEGGSGAGAGRPRLVAGSAALRLGGELPGDASSQLSSLRRLGGPSEPDIPITCVAAAPPQGARGGHVCTSRSAAETIGVATHTHGRYETGSCHAGTVASVCARRRRDRPGGHCQAQVFLFTRRAAATAAAAAAAPVCCGRPAPHRGGAACAVVTHGGGASTRRGQQHRRGGGPPGALRLLRCPVTHEHHVADAQSWRREGEPADWRSGRASRPGAHTVSLTPAAQPCWLCVAPLPTADARVLPVFLPLRGGQLRGLGAQRQV